MAAAIDEEACRSSIAAAERDAYVNFIFGGGGFGKGYRFDDWVEKFGGEGGDEFFFGSVAVLAESEELLVRGCVEDCDVVFCVVGHLAFLLAGMWEVGGASSASHD